MVRRTKGRELAVQVLYSFHNNTKSIDEIFDDDMFDKVADFNREYATIITKGIVANKEMLEDIISKYSKNWKIKRIALIDKIILLIAIYEMKFMPEIPHPVAIDEAIVLSKKFSDTESGKFINGILDAVNKNEKFDTHKKNDGWIK
ncbi:MAG: transcription antitermination protein NusB [uncultured bacterium]|nr:MAG: transcription antitermination protein NusB [uncultured bacterium]